MSSSPKQAQLALGFNTQPESSSKQFKPQNAEADQAQAATLLSKAVRKAENIANDGLTINSPIEVGDESYWLTSAELTVLLNDKMVGQSFQGLALRTRSKVAKSSVCEALGYVVPNSFPKVQPRFPGQCFDTYVQKSNNLQVWNEELAPDRRYVIIGVDADDTVTKVRVITGADLAKLDTTGTLTQKYQARLIRGANHLELISPNDTEVLALASSNLAVTLSGISPTDAPSEKQLLPISAIFSKLSSLISMSFPDIGITQERNRGAELHKLVCKALGYDNYKDNGQFPDVNNQLLEVKLQTSTTIDLGLVSPDSEAKLDLEKLFNDNVRHCDVRYAIFFAETKSGVVTITDFYLTTGRDFFSRFTQFGGNVLNKKIQIGLPKGFFLDTI
ncbi:hypothetical protein HNQ93_004223 [Hymenobacter luteus]|uniref:Restriction endonuclease n=2 Tax=Hymenobacter TaxID=89966 RepID=A0A7W9WCW3_9BACT|nr:MULTISPECIES: restriction endonuclease [Hymenobacter]MBB4603596.1 hypothetical protein [Hymenobacter latericoloratus]MBB6061344.1 hypothetical protein [Hymenobacter luteus]